MACGVRSAFIDENGVVRSSLSAPPPLPDCRAVASWDGNTITPPPPLSALGDRKNISPKQYPLFKTYGDVNSPSPRIILDSQRCFHSIAEPITTIKSTLPASQRGKVMEGEGRLRSDIFTDRAFNQLNISSQARTCFRVDTKYSQSEGVSLRKTLS